MEHNLARGGPDRPASSGQCIYGWLMRCLRHVCD